MTTHHPKDAMPVFPHQLLDQLVQETPTLAPFLLSADAQQQTHGAEQSCRRVARFAWFKQMLLLLTCPASHFCPEHHSTRYDGEVREPLVGRQGSRVSMRVAQERVIAPEPW